MKKVYKLEDLDCANCAAKMECAIKKLDGVNDATVSFMAQRLTIEADDDKFEEIMDNVQKFAAKSSPIARSCAKCKTIRNFSQNR